MKRYIFLVSTLLSGALLTGCAEDFLEVKPVVQKTDQNYYNTPEEAQEALVGCYDGLQGLSGDLIFLAPEIASDDCSGSEGSGDADNYNQINTLTDMSIQYPDFFNEAWSAYYKLLNRCNTLIQKIDQISGWSNEGEKLSILAQARFIRAYAYFDLVRSFGHCPLLVEPSNEIIPCSQYKEIYTQIFEDFKFAAQNGLEGDYDGHATKYSAAGLLARAYLFYTGYYGEEAPNVTKSEVISFLEDVKGELMSNPYKLWPAAAQQKAKKENGDFHECYSSPVSDYGYAGELNKEVLFSIRYTYTGAYGGSENDGNLFSLYVSPRAGKGGGTEGLSDKDLQKNGWASGWGIACASKEIFDSFEAGDMRKEASIIDIKNEISASFDTKTADGSSQYTSYSIKKYCTTGDFDDNGDYNYSCLINNSSGHMNLSQTQDFIVLRYADVLLMLSELKEDVEGMNKVHERATGVANYYTAYDKEKLFQERQWELCFEGIRYWDMLRYDGRQGDFAYAKKCLAGPQGNGVYKLINAGVEDDVTVDYNRLSKTKGLFHIPLNQITISGGAITQNEGYK